MDMQNDGKPETVEVVGGIGDSVKNMFDSVKGPVFWLAVGFVICKFMDRKKTA